MNFTPFEIESVAMVISASNCLFQYLPVCVTRESRQQCVLAQMLQLVATSQSGSCEHTGLGFRPTDNAPSKAEIVVRRLRHGFMQSLPVRQRQGSRSLSGRLSRWGPPSIIRTSLKSLINLVYVLRSSGNGYEVASCCLKN